MIEKRYIVEVRTFGCYIGETYSYREFDTLKKALEYKKSDNYGNVRLHGIKWAWELDEPARPNKPLELWRLEQELGVRFKDHKTVYYFGDNYSDEFESFQVYDHLAAWDLIRNDQRVYLAKISLDGEEVEEVMVEDDLPF